MLSAESSGRDDNAAVVLKNKLPGSIFRILAILKLFLRRLKKFDLIDPLNFGNILWHMPCA